MIQLLPSFPPERRRGAVVPRLRLLERFNADLVRGNEAPLGIGIGINTGRAIVGSIGSPERMEFSVIGNTVKVASRIEGLNKTLGTSLLLSKATKDHLTRRISLRALPPQQVKGVGAPVEIFTIEPYRPRHFGRAAHRTARGRSRSIAPTCAQL